MKNKILVLLLAGALYGLQAKSSESKTITLKNATQEQLSSLITFCANLSLIDKELLRLLQLTDQERDKIGTNRLKTVSALSCKGIKNSEGKEMVPQPKIDANTSENNKIPYSILANRAHELLQGMREAAKAEAKAKPDAAVAEAKAKAAAEKEEEEEEKERFYLERFGYTHSDDGW